MSNEIQNLKDKIEELEKKLSEVEEERDDLNIELENYDCEDCDHKQIEIQELESELLRYKNCFGEISDSSLGELNDMRDLLNGES